MSKEKLNYRFSVLGSIAIAVIVVSLFSLGLQFTGKATDTATLNITIPSMANINFTIDSINFGSGTINTTGGFRNATLVTNGTIVGGNWTTVNNGFSIDNTGNNNVSIDIKTGLNAIGFIGGANPVYQYSIENNEAGSCGFPVGFTENEWYNVNTTSPGTRVCANLSYNDISDSINISIKLIIFTDAIVGEKTDTFTATATVNA